MHSEPFVAIIAINFNQAEVTAEFIESFKKINYHNYEIIIVDNNSTKPLDPIDEVVFDFTLIKSKKNLGFAGGNNLGIKSIDADYYFIVNNDTEAPPDIISNLIQPFYEDNKLGIVCPKIKYFDNPRMIQYAGYTKINPFTGRNKVVGGKQIDNGQFNTPNYTHYAHGAAMMIKKEVFDVVGLMRDDYFLYYEELDFSSRVVKNGFKIRYEPRAEIYHKESMSVGKNSKLKEYYLARNRILFMKRNFTKDKFIIFMVFFMLVSLPYNVLKLALKGDFGMLKAYLRGIFMAI